MTLRFYDTRARAVRPFVPVVDGAVSIYVCGPTVQSAPHVGHARSAVVFDVLRRWLTARGFAVTFIRNVTDVDDKILHNAGHEGVQWWALAERNSREFLRAYEALGVLPPTGEPRATGHLPEMIALIGRLVATGRAYPAGGDVYFDVRADPAYGELSGQRIDAMLAAEESAGKRDPLDFALWKAAKPGEPAWDSPWGPGRPGWHIECSAMATRYLGPTFDIHGGGLDLVFPHHENELAQSRGAGDPFARYWLHNGLVAIRGEKMSKSLGNSLVVSEVLATVPPAVLRYYLAAPHYRSTLDWSPEGLADAAAAYARIETFVANALDALGGVVDEPLGEPVAGAAPGSSGAARAAFAAAMDDDLATPRAFGELHAAVRAGNTALAAGDRQLLRETLRTSRWMLDTLGFDPVGQPSGGGSSLRPVVDALVAIAIQARADARARRDYPAGDAIRAALGRAGVLLEDTPDGTRWRLGAR